MKDSGYRFSSLAAMLLAVSATTSIMPYNIPKHDQKQVQNAEKATTWHVRSNQCALGNDPPPGSNCSK